ncbi:MAG: globin family protein [Cyanobacteria bacterium P01_D01_bin.1]
MALNVELLEQSFELVKPKADDFVASFYNNLFTDYPDAKPLFESTSMAGQQQMLKGALVMVVDNLRKPEVLSKSLKGLGARHVKYGALPEHYPLVGNSLLKTLGQYAGTAWTTELETAWATAYGAITELMLEGADYNKESVALKTPVSTETPVLEDPTVSATVPATDGSETSDEPGLDVELLEQSFELVKPKADEFVASFYGNLLTDYPEAKPLFAHTSMPKQQQMLKGALVMVIENLREPEVLSEALRGLGARHVKYGALPEHYPLVGSSLLKTLEQYAGSAWTPPVKDAWIGAYGAITELMLDGADYSKSEVQLSEPAPVEPVPIQPKPVAVPKAQTAPMSITEAAIDPPEGIGSGTAAGIIGGSAAALVVLLLILL